MISKEFFATTNNKAPHKMEANAILQTQLDEELLLRWMRVANVNAPNSALKEGTETQWQVIESFELHNKLI